MTRVQVACYCLIASAFVLAGMLVTQLGGSVEPKANAELLVSQQNFSMMTAEAREGDEALYILDNTTGTLLVYRMNLGQKRMELGATLGMNQLFGGGGGGGGGGGMPRRR